LCVFCRYQYYFRIPQLVRRVPQIKNHCIKGTCAVWKDINTELWTGLWSYAVWCHVVWYIGTNVSEEPTASILRTIWTLKMSIFYMLVHFTLFMVCLLVLAVAQECIVLNHRMVDELGSNHDVVRKPSNVSVKTSSSLVEVWIRNLQKCQKKLLLEPTDSIQNVGIYLTNYWHHISIP
jgi:predicted membrane protein